MAQVSDTLEPFGQKSSPGVSPGTKNTKIGTKTAPNPTPGHADKNRKATNPGRFALPFHQQTTTTKGTKTMTEPLSTGDRVVLASGITPEVGTVGATGTATLNGHAVQIAEVIWPIGSVPETTTISGARKLHTVPELRRCTPYEQVADAVAHCVDCAEVFEFNTVCQMHSKLLDVIGGDNENA
jgi:hypothetical protein